jgi:hypothetical protein
MSQGYSLNFRMYMEGILTPFKSANIMCTPNGVEASINMFATKAIYNLKPKTAIQIFYKDWTPPGNRKIGWRLMFDGYYSSIVKDDSATEGRMITIVCRDFRMDIRKAPAAISYIAGNKLTATNLYSMQGIFDRIVVPGINDSTQSAGGFKPREYEDILCPLDQTLRLIAGTAYGDAATQKEGDYPNGTYGNVLHTDERGKAKCGFFLDAVVRGMWVEAAGGTSLGAFLNKRIRADKRFYIPANKAGYNFWDRQAAGLNVGTYMMNNSMFVSLESAIMSCAALFSVKTYATSTPSLIPVGLDTITNPNPAAKYTIDEDVSKFLIERNGSDFGAPYVLNESMLLPSFEFTAPPNFNIFLPPMCDRVSWQYDMDADITRGYYEVLDSLSAYDTSGIEKIRIQVPNALFDIYEETKKTDTSGRYKPPLTLEERYKGVSVSYGNVEYDIAANEAAASQLDWTLTKEKADEIKKLISDLKNSKSNMENIRKAVSNLKNISDKDKEEVKKKLDAVELRKIQITTDVQDSAVTIALKRHAILKFFNEKYSGRVVTIDMVFNPYPMCGFPGMYIDDEEAGGGNSSKTVIGMVQQIRHLIYIAPNGAEASTSVVMNNARFIDEPVDIDMNGNALFMKATDRKAAAVDPKTFEYLGKPIEDTVVRDRSYYVPEPLAATERVLNNNVYDLKQQTLSKEYIYAKDLLSITENDAINGESNIMYLDKEYDPQHIASFYRDVFGQTKSFMVGVEGGKYFMYDTMHEASINLRSKRKELLYDYTEAMKFASRNVCSADAFFQGILGLSVKIEKEVNGKKKTIYVCEQKNFVDDAIYNEYFGVTTALYNGHDIDQLKTEFNGMITGPGDCSSILETMPVTSFIKERKDAVRKYINDVKSVGQGIPMTEPKPE